MLIYGLWSQLGLSARPENNEAKAKARQCEAEAETETEAKR